MLTEIEDLAHYMNLPVAGFIAIIAGVGVLLLVLLICCCTRGCRCRRRRKKKKGPDTKSLQKLSAEAKLRAEMEEQAQAELTEEQIEAAAAKALEKYLGRIQYRLDYEFESTSLHVTIIKCEQLAALDVGGTSDPYVKVYFLPDKKKKYETKVQKKTLNPVFNETFTYKASFSELISKTIMLCVYDYDRLSKHDLIGEVKIPLCLVDLGRSIEEWRDLERVEVDHKALGEICFSIRYVPTTGKLSVVVLEAKNLKKMDVGGASDPYVKVCIFYKGKRVKKKKSTVKKHTLNPYFNESFSFEMPFEQIQMTHLQVTVVDYDRVGHSDPIGRVVLGMNATGAELRHWAEMVANPRRPVAQWHKLKDPDKANYIITGDEPPDPKEKKGKKDKKEDKHKKKEEKLKKEKKSRKDRF
ncbi:C2 domain [Trinorchestia longiramus]|nr:C2 domain [Trinorchestia longiramus]